MNKGKIKIVVQKAGRYLRELSVIAVGVAITLSASNWLASRSEKKDTALYLNALKLELEQDTTLISGIISIFERSAGYVRYIRSHDKQLLDSDSIGSFRDIYYNVITYAPQTSAFEMFKTSGNMRFINNKETLQSIWDAYAGMEQLKVVLDLYYDYKRREIEKEGQSITEGKQVDIPMYIFYSTERDDGILEQCRETLLAVKRTLANL